ncbi:hypothetical protein K3495_g3778 [Podosphaera aphanis]|nr:hypothetical protein K3495_g3778 [Podosphaera aphanis]
MAKSQQSPPLAQRVAEELELVQRVAKGLAIWVPNFHTKFWASVEEADPLIKPFVREQIDAFLLAVASGHPMRHHSDKQPKSAGSLPKPSQSLPLRPPAPTSKKASNWVATAAGPPATLSSASASIPARARPNATHCPSHTTTSKVTTNKKGPRAILCLSEKVPLLKADVTSVKAALLLTVPGPTDRITSVSRSSNGFSIFFSSDTSLKLAMDNADSVKASLSGSLFQIMDRIGYVVKRIPRTIWNPVSNLVTTTLDDVKSTTLAQIGLTPSGAH